MRAILYACVAAGGVLGSVARYFVALLIPPAFGFPFATLLVNVTGSFIIGFYSALTAPDGRLLAGTRQRQFVMTGFCGGYTTFSAFSLETFRLLHGGMTRMAFSYVAVSVVTWLVAVWLGHVLASRVNRLKGEG
jgi:fluoride exporter